MARILNLPDQRLTLTLPEQGEVFRIPGSGQVGKLVGNTIEYSPEGLYDSQALSSMAAYDSSGIQAALRYKIFNEGSVSGRPFTIEPVAQSGEVFTRNAPELASFGNRIRTLPSDIRPAAATYNTSGVDPRLLDLQRQLQSLGQQTGTLSQQRGVALTPQFQQQFGTPTSIPSVPAATQSLTGNPLMDETLVQLQGFVDELKKRGQVLNPNIELTPDRIAEFLKVAENEINPYYTSQLKIARENLLTQAGYSRDEILRNEADLERKYAIQTRQIGEQAAEQGFAQSGLRRRSEQELALGTQQQIETGRRKLGFDLTSLAGRFAQQYGTPPTSPVLFETPTVGAGELSFGKGTRQLPLYELSPETYQGLIGEQEFARRAAIRQRTSEQEAAQRTLLASQQQRQLVL